MRHTLLIFAFLAGGFTANADDAPRPVHTVPHVAPPDVKRGDKVIVNVISGGVLLTFEAQTESSGHIGETVILLNPDNGRRFVAKVEDKGKVVVKK
jgi:flagella basal body P-ring formation protein FlgA